MTISLEDLRYRPLSDACPKGDFRCGEPDLDKWFQKKSHAGHENYTCRVVTVHHGNGEEPLGFYAIRLMLESDRLLLGGGPVRNRTVNGVYPALHLEYLAVASKYQGFGIGPDMVLRALVTYRRAIVDLGIPVMTLVPLREELVKFYSDRGFVPYAKHLGERRMMLTAHQAMTAYEMAQAEIKI